ncbi:uncharacterized protein RHO17_006838 isoform 1-T1 [Thomomys bottae]
MGARSPPTPPLGTPSPCSALHPQLLLRPHWIAPQLRDLTCQLPSSLLPPPPRPAATSTSSTVSRHASMPATCVTPGHPHSLLRSPRGLCLSRRDGLVPCRNIKQVSKWSTDLNPHMKQLRDQMVNFHPNVKQSLIKSLKDKSSYQPK